MRGLLGAQFGGWTLMCSVCSCPHSAAAYCKSKHKSYFPLQYLAFLLISAHNTTPIISSKRQPGLPHQHFLSIGVCVIPVQAEVQHFQARAACHHYAGKRCNSGLLARGYALAIHLIMDMNLQASHLYIKINVVARRAAAVLSARSLALL